MIRRIFFFALINIAIIVMGSVALFLIERFFGISITGSLRSSYSSLAIFAVVYGFIGSGISLLLSRWMAKRFHHIQLIDADMVLTSSAPIRLVYHTVARIAQEHNITMPEVGIYESPEVNAFATGATRNSSLVAVSSGLLAEMEEGEIEGVVAHEMAHILNGDMVTMTLLQGVINAFVIFFSRVLANIVSSALKKDDHGFIYFGVTIVLEILLGLLGSLVLMAYSRRREYAADAGSAGFVGKTKMIDALKALQRIHALNLSVKTDPKLATLKIDGSSTGFLHLFASHPPLEDRISQLQNNNSLV